MDVYKYSKIYRFYSISQNIQHIGCTTQILKLRLSNQLSRYKRWSSYSISNRFKKSCYDSVFEILKYPDCQIELIENFSCNSRAELRDKCEEYISGKIIPL